MAIGQGGTKTVLIDGSLQFGDMRALLKVPVEAPSLLDLPTDRIQESDLAGRAVARPVGHRHPPRAAAGRDGRDGHGPRPREGALRCCAACTRSWIVDTPAVVNDINLAFLDTSDTILEVVTYDSTTIHSTMVMADAFRMIGYPPSKVRYLVNRADSTGGHRPRGAGARPSGGKPEHFVSSGGALVVHANNEGIPFALADPSAQISQDVMRTARRSGPAGFRSPPRGAGKRGGVGPEGPSACSTPASAA